MRILSFVPCALSVGALAFAIGGCASQGSSSFTAPLGTEISQSRVPNGRKAWMRPESKSGDLLYVTDGCDGTCVLSYPSGKLVGSLNVGGFVNAGACADSQGNVFISNYNSVVEYPHGKNSPVATFSLPGVSAAGCAIDPTTGSLAVVYQGSNTNIAIFPPGSNSPSLYESGLDSSTCAYDSYGNLFVAGLNGQTPQLAELPSGDSQFRSIRISGNVGLPGQLQWANGRLNYESVNKRNAFVYQLSLSGSSASVVGTTPIKGPAHVYYSWIYGNRILVPYSGHGANAQKLGIWKYPQGGKGLSSFKHFAGTDARLQSVVVSLDGTTLSRP